MSVNHKGNKQCGFFGMNDSSQKKPWVWLALDADTREIVGVYIGARDEDAARKLWQSLPGVYSEVSWTEASAQGALRQCAIAYTDFLVAISRQFYRHSATLAVGKETGFGELPNRDSTTPCVNESPVRYEKPYRSRASLENHIGAIWYFIHAYNKSLLL